MKNKFLTNSNNKIKKTNKINRWSVWVGGSEVNDHYLTYEKATELYIKYVNKAYTDVVVRWEEK